MLRCHLRLGLGGEVRSRKLLAALTVTLLITFAAPTESTARFYGVYDWFTYASTPKQRLFKTDHERFSAMRSAGLNTVLNYATFRMSIKGNLRYARAAQQHGVRVLWALHYYAPDAPRLSWKLRLVKRTKELPATLGYYVGDEVMFGTDEARQMEELTAYIESRTKKKTLYTAEPNPAEVTPFAGWTDWLAVDPYPVGYPAGAGGTAAEEVGAAMSWAGAAVRPSALAVALQLFSWSYYQGVDGHGVTARWPTPEEVDSMRRAAEGAWPKVVLWFSFYNVTDRRRARRSLAYWNLVAPHLAP
jgi:hypothetical protein